jgi:hypothetical protein
MNTISEETTRHLAFRETQLLPLLTPEVITRRGGATALSGVRPHSESSAEKTTKYLAFKKTQWLPRLTPEMIPVQGGAKRSPATESTAKGVGQIFAAMIELSAIWPMLSVWGVRLLG